MNENIRILDEFQFKGEFASIQPYGDGHINDTYKVTYRGKYDEEYNYIFQKVNHIIFKRTDELMKNIENVTSYLTDIIKDVEEDKYQVLTLIKTKDNKGYYKSLDGDYYRAYVFIENSVGHTFTENVDLLYEAGKSFGEFQKLLKDFPVEDLEETIENFHHTPTRLSNFMKVYESNPNNLNDSCKEEIDFVLNRSSIASVITDEISKGKVPLRVTHNDTKLNNVLMDIDTQKGICVIDLDTVMPGSTLYDFGDAIRSCGSTVVEDEEDLSKLDLDLDRFRAFTKGFLEILKDDLTEEEIRLLPMGAILMTFECGIRFLEDHLSGNVYFKVHKTDHNLIRARNQFKFVEVMEQQLEAMRGIVSKCC